MGSLMKPIDRIKRIMSDAQQPVAARAVHPDGHAPQTYTLSTAELQRIMNLTADAYWAAAFIDRLREEAHTAAKFGKEQRDYTDPVPPEECNYEAGEEPHGADPWAQGFHDGTAHTKGMLGRLLYTDPDSFGPSDSAFRTPELEAFGLTVDAPTVLEFSREDQP